MDITGDQYIFEATEQEYSEVKTTSGWWVAKVTYAPADYGEPSEVRYFKFVRAYEVKITDFYGMQHGLGPVIEINII